VEIDAQRRLLNQFAGGEREFLDETQATLKNLEDRLKEVDKAVADPAAFEKAKPPWWDENQPPRLFGKSELTMEYDEYLKALGHVFPQRYLDEVTRIVDDIGKEAAANVAADPAFVEMCQNRNWAQAGTRFHNEAKDVGRAMVASGKAPAGWMFEYTVQSGLGGSRLDVVARGPAGEVLEFDWKTTGRSALSTKSRVEMVKHAQHIGMNMNTPLQTQTSVSWVELVRPHLTTHPIRWP